jgi:hypothetical protein
MLTVLIVVVLIVAAFLVLLAFRPNTFRVQRTVVIAAPADRIYPYIADFHADGWGQWSPWEGIDPNLKRTFSGAESGLGAVYNWDGDNKVGSGRMEIVRAEPSRIDIKLDFYKPMKNSTTAQFTIDPDGAAQRVTWAMSGPVPYMARAFHLIFNMDKMIGGQFDQGLQKLKARAEA